MPQINDLIALICGFFIKNSYLIPDLFYCLKNDIPLFKHLYYGTIETKYMTILNCLEQTKTFDEKFFN